MLTEERHSIILDMVNSHGSVKIGELCAMLDSSVCLPLIKAKLL